MSIPAALTIPFATLLQATALDCGLNTDSTAGTITASALDQSQLARYLTRAMRWAWQEPGQPWPDTIQGAAVNVSAGVISLDQINFGQWWRLFNIDPRPRNAQYRKIDATRDGQGLWPKSELTSLFALFQPRAPEFSTVAVSDTTYPINTIVYDASGTLDCYKALVANANGAALTDATQWERQVCYDFLQTAVAGWAAALWYRFFKASKDEAEALEETAKESLEQEYQKYFNQSV